MPTVKEVEPIITGTDHPSAYLELYTNAPGAVYPASKYTVAKAGAKASLAVPICLASPASM